jgi:hypothetical protein
VAISLKRTVVASTLAVAAFVTSAHAAQPPVSSADRAAPVSLTAKSPQKQGKKVFVHVKASTTERLEFLRITGRIRVSGMTTYFRPNRTGTVEAGTSHTFSMAQDDPDQRRIVRKAMKRGKDLKARIRCDFHLENGGNVIVRKVQVELVYQDLDRGRA